MTGFYLLALSLLSILFVSGSREKRTEQICKSTDIRNSVESFHRLDNCTVIEGNLQILLIDYAKIEDYEKLQFPNLVEITGYLLLYRVFHLRTLRHLFPNLTVIRGNNLFFNYALVIFEMFHFQEIGLVGLTDIKRGFIRIEKNPDLCYIDTVDWGSIVKAGKDDHFIMDNKKQDECANSCPNTSVCPSRYIDQTQTSLCWTSQDCQKGYDPSWSIPSASACPSPCESKLCVNGICCHKECLGGCRGSKSEDCFACQNVFFDGRCLNSCPFATYKYLNRRCITFDECIAIKPDDASERETFMKIHNNTCIEECPPGFTVAENNKHHCNACSNSSCPKICKGVTIDSVATAQSLTGCTVISGPLEIHIRGGKKIAQELEESLHLIEEVTYYVKIARSFPIMSLNFLRNLKLIRGEKLANDIYALYVLDNENLRELWPPEHKLQILNGKMFFHFNPKLCPINISQLEEIVNLTGKLDDRDISPVSNGDKVACNVNELSIAIVRVNSNSAVIQWPTFHTEDPRSLLGYVVGYKEAPVKNVTIYGGRDACGSDDWKIIDVAANNDKVISEFIPDLNPWTQYAFFVQTYTIASEKQGAQSPVLYFQTEPAMPTPPVEVRGRSNSSSELIITWKPPNKTNGNVTHYYVYWQRQPEDSSLFDQRNYCEEPLRHLPVSRKEETTVILPDKIVTNQTDGKCCECAKDEKQRKFEEHQVLYQIQFENFLHNYVYIKRPMPSINPQDSQGAEKNDNALHNRLKRQMPTISTIFVNQSATNETDKNGTSNKDSQVYFATTVYHKTDTILKDLQHFSEYSIEVIACHEENVQNGTKLCSNRAITVVRTLPLKTADNINMSSIQIDNRTNQTGAVLLSWDDPLQPNGLIITYELEYKKLNIENYKPNPICVPYKDFSRTKSYTLKGLSPGNYSFRLRATSLAGNGSWTDYLYFYVQDVEVINGGFQHTQILIIIGVIASLALTIIVAATACFITKKKFSDKNLPNGILYASVNPEYMSAADVYVPDEWEAPREKISLIRELGQGSFGMVYEGEARDLVPNKNVIRCAVKTVNENASIRERIEFLNEASVMKAFDCYHVVKLLGVVSKGHPTLVIMELMARGDLKSYLRSHRPDEENGIAQPPSLKQILQMSGEIADGMAYLAAKKFVHRDLAARNCMVAEDLTVKIGDFGMTRDIYETDYYRKGGKGLLPVRWMAPESLKDGVFTSLSDVWSFGVVLWEMATLASQPYQGLSNEQVLKYVIDGGIMEKPENCPDKLYELMKLCWQHAPKARPTFMEVIEILLADLNENFRKISFYFSQEDKSRSDIIEIDNDVNPEAEAVCPLTHRDENSIDSDYNDLSSDEEISPSCNEGATGLSNSESRFDSKDNKMNGQSVSKDSVVNGSLNLQSPKCTEC